MTGRMAQHLAVTDCGDVTSHKKPTVVKIGKLTFFSRRLKNQEPRTHFPVANTGFDGGGNGRGCSCSDYIFDPIAQSGLRAWAVGALQPTKSAI
jgi:hypothetical protein